MAESIAFGKEGGAEKIADVLLKTSSEKRLSQKFEDKWLVSLLAVDLGTNVKRIKQLKDDLMENRLQPLDALTGIIKDWIAKNGKNASLGKLIFAVSLNGLGNYAEAIKAKFNDNPSDSEAEDSFFASPVQEALDNPVILSNIFDKLEVDEQKNFRLVKKLWRDVTLDYFRKTVLVHIDIDMDSEEYESTHSFEKFEKILPGGMYEAYRIVEVPFRRFRLCWDWQAAVMEERLCEFRDLDRFWTLFSPKLERLELEYLCCAGTFFENVKWILLEGGRKELKELKLIECSFNEDDGSEENATKKKLKEGKTKSEDNDNVKTAEKLTSLNLQDVICKTGDLKRLLLLIPNLKEFSSDFHSANKVMKALCSSETTPKKFIKLEVLKIDTKNDKTLGLVLGYLRAARPVLKNLELACDRYESIRAPPFLFYTILSHPSLSTLVRLKVELPLFQDTWVTDFTRRVFPNLQEFHLTVYEDKWKEESMKFDFKALRGMPKLRSFSCILSNLMGHIKVRPDLSEEELFYEGETEWMGDDDDEPAEDDSSNSNRIQLDRLEEFKFRLYRKFDISCLRKLASWAKNLRKLRLVLSNDTFKSSLDLWPGLTELSYLEGSTVSKKVIEEERKERSTRIMGDPYPYDQW